jgi:hypothetical protein
MAELRYAGSADNTRLLVQCAPSETPVNNAVTGPDEPLK